MRQESLVKKGGSVVLAVSGANGPINLKPSSYGPSFRLVYFYLHLGKIFELVLLTCSIFTLSTKCKVPALGILDLGMLLSFLFFYCLFFTRVAQSDPTNEIAVAHNNNGNIGVRASNLETSQLNLNLSVLLDKDAVVVPLYLQESYILNQTQSEEDETNEPVEDQSAWKQAIKNREEQYVKLPNAIATVELGEAMVLSKVVEEIGDENEEVVNNATLPDIVINTNTTLISRSINRTETSPLVSSKILPAKIMHTFGRMNPLAMKYINMYKNDLITSDFFSGTYYDNKDLKKNLKNFYMVQRKGDGKRDKQEPPKVCLIEKCKEITSILKIMQLYGQIKDAKDYLSIVGDPKTAENPPVCTEKCSSLFIPPVVKTLLVLTTCNHIDMTAVALDFMMQPNSLSDYDYKFDILIVDDHSVDGSATYFKKRYLNLSALI